MNNSNIRQDRKFEKQVNHMSAFIGMPQLNANYPTLSEIRENDRRLLERQAQGFKPRRASLLKRFARKIEMAFKKASEKKEPVETGSECCS